MIFHLVNFLRKLKSTDALLILFVKIKKMRKKLI